eukprot:COSAG03_NODE_26103_length_261_cov_0.950617_1_plen_42_part_01
MGRAGSEEVPAAAAAAAAVGAALEPAGVESGPPWCSRTLWAL